jgi:16S rRNA (cytosine967-C5)-methyltransferase
MIGRARVAAYEILRRVSTGRADLPAAVADLRDTLADDRDRALATDIATGTERWLGAIDHLIAHYAARPTSKLDPEVVDILRLSIYQLLHLTRVPAAAVVDDGVELARRAGKRSAAGFVNAVLRNVSRGRRALPLPPRPSDSTDREAALDYLSITLSHPRWLAARWLARVGLERAEAWMTFDNVPALLTVRANPLRVTRDSLLERFREQAIDAHPARYAPDGIVIDRGSLREEAARGEFVMQDEASQLVALLAGQEPGPLVLDTCASPGGKATAIAMTLGIGERVIACDVRERRMALLRRTVHATGAGNVRLVQADATAPLPFRAQFSTVVVDAPCSGLGTLRRDPDIRWKRQEAELTSMSATQQRLLEHASTVVAPGGRLVYATCSSEPEENEQVVAAFLDTHREFAAIRADLANEAIAAELVDASGHLRTEPDRHGLEFFFGAVFGRTRNL